MPVDQVATQLVSPPENMNAKPLTAEKINIALANNLILTRLCEKVINTVKSTKSGGTPTKRKSVLSVIFRKNPQEKIPIIRGKF